MNVNIFQPIIGVTIFLSIGVLLSNILLVSNVNRSERTVISLIGSLLFLPSLLVLMNIFIKVPITPFTIGKTAIVVFVGLILANILLYKAPKR